MRLLDQSQSEPSWWISPASQEGYIYNYCLETSPSTDQGDKISVDFNPSRNMVRIKLTLAAEMAKEYIAVIKSGNILQQRENISRKPLDLTSRISPFAKYFCQLDEPGILQVIDGNFQLPKATTTYPKKELKYSKSFFKTGPSLWQLIKRHLVAKRQAESQLRGFGQRLLRRIPQESFDLSIGGLSFWACLQGYLDFAELAFVCGFLGIFGGAIDIFWRGRNPFIPKVAFFVGVSAVIVYFQVQYRMWAIYL